MKTLLTWKDISGWFTVPEGEAIQDVCKGKIVLEIGPYQGRSTCCIAEVAESVTTIEHFLADDCIRKLYPQPRSPDELFDDLVNNLRACGVTEKVTIINGDWQTNLVPTISLLRLKHGHDVPHVIFYDADHNVGPVCNFLEQMVKCRFGGTICIHDYKPKEYLASVEEIDEFINSRGSTFKLIGSLMIIQP